MAAAWRLCPSRTSAIANMRRAADASELLPAARRRSDAVRSSRIIFTVMIASQLAIFSNHTLSSRSKQFFAQKVSALGRWY
jgi:hypothetical protein